MKVDATLSQTHSLPTQPSCGSLKSRSQIYPSPVASLIYPDGQANIHSSSCFFYHSPTGQSTTYTHTERKSLVSFFLVCPLICYWPQARDNLFFSLLMLTINSIIYQCISIQPLAMSTSSPTRTHIFTCILHVRVESRSRELQHYFTMYMKNRFTPIDK